MNALETESVGKVEEVEVVIAVSFVILLIFDGRSKQAWDI